MSRILNKYRYFCSTEQQYKYIWSESIPTSCIIDSNHSIDLQSLTIVDRVKENKVEVTDNNTYTKGNYMIKGFSQTIPATNETSFQIKFPFNTTIFCVGLQATTNEVGDTVGCSAGGLIPLGTLTAPASAGTSELCLSTPAIANIDNGLVVFAESNKLGIVSSVDATNNKITLDSTLTSDLDTNVTISIKRMLLDNYKITISGVHEFGKNKIGGQNLPANIPLEIYYYNLSGQEKEVNFNIEYTY